MVRDSNESESADMTRFFKLKIQQFSQPDMSLTTSEHLQPQKYEKDMSHSEKETCESLLDDFGSVQTKRPVSDAID